MRYLARWKDTHKLLSCSYNIYNTTYILHFHWCWLHLRGYYIHKRYTWIKLSARGIYTTCSTDTSILYHHTTAGRGIGLVLTFAHSFIVSDVHLYTFDAACIIYVYILYILRCRVNNALFLTQAYVHNILDKKKKEEKKKKSDRQLCSFRPRDY